MRKTDKCRNVCKLEIQGLQINSCLKFFNVDFAQKNKKKQINFHKVGTTKV